MGAIFIPTKKTTPRHQPCRGDFNRQADRRFGPSALQLRPSIKVAVAGSGRASKAQVQMMVARLLGVVERLATDEADALGAAICHVYAGRFNALVAEATTWGGRAVDRRSRTSWRR